MTVVAREVWAPARLAAVARTGLLDTPREEAFDRLARLAVTVLKTATAFVTIVDERRSFWKACVGPGGTSSEARENPVEQSFCQYVIGSGTPLVVDDARTDPLTRDNPSVELMGVGAWAGFPVYAPDGQVLGTFCAVDSSARRWSPHELDVLETLAHAVSGEVALRSAVEDAQAASQRALRNAQESGELAKILQESLLPPELPRIPGVDLSARYLPGGSGVEVLGDFYDAFAVPEGWGIVVGDVCGKGPQAAKSTALTRSSVRAVSHLGLTTVEVLTTVHDVLYQWFGERTSFVTVAYATIHPTVDGLRVRLCLGGHPPALIRRPDGTVTEFGTKGTLLGCVKNVRLNEEDTILTTGSVLVLYTDGVTEARAPASTEQFGDQRLHQLLTNLPPDQTATEIAAAIEHHVLRFTGGIASDDIAIVVLRNTTPHS
ncbi:MAG: GAF domain-containing SpoIIE family protein phosphatase [Pseudonocardiaceae bacterium]